MKKRIISVALAAIMSVSMFATVASADKWVTTTAGTKYQYTDGTYAKSKWIETKSGKYYINSKGIRATGMVNINNADGTKDTYYFNSKGIMQKGWIKYNNKLYYFQQNGKAVKNKKLKVNGYCYKFDSNGVWNGKVYDSTGKKDVTSKVDVEKLTGIKLSNTNKTTVSKNNTENVNEEVYTLGKAKKLPDGTEIPETVTIKGKVYRTQATNTFKGNTPDPIYPEGSKYTKWMIDIRGCTDKDLECLKYFTNLQDLAMSSGGMWDEGTKDEQFWYNGGDVPNPAKITNLDFVYYMPKLKSISIKVAPKLTNIDGISACKNLTSVSMWKTGITNVDALGYCTKLKEVTLDNNKLTNIDGLANCVNLKEVYIYSNQIKDIGALGNSTKLIALDASDNKIEDVEFLRNHKTLERVLLTGNNIKTKNDVLDTIKSMKYIAPPESWRSLYDFDSDATFADFVAWFRWPMAFQTDNVKK